MLHECGSGEALLSHCRVAAAQSVMVVGGKKWWAGGKAVCPTVRPSATMVNRESDRERMGRQIKALGQMTVKD